MLSKIYNKEEQALYKRPIKYFWILTLGGILLAFIVFLLISIGALGYMPSMDELENPKSALASEVISSDQAVLGLYYSKNRTIVEFDELSPFLVQALIATEDSRFQDHSGIDIRSLMRVLVKTMLLGQKNSGGGSTITQQLAKNLFPRGESSVIYTAKFKEWITAARLEKRFTKDEIVALYFNTVEYGNNAYGIKAASKTYFNKKPSDLKIEEAAVLVGLLKGTTMYNPKRNPDRSKERRNVVLSQMEKYNFLTKAELDSLTVLPLEMNFQPQTHNTGLAAYFRENLRLMLTADEPDEDDYYSESDYEEALYEWENNPLYGWCNKNEKPDGSEYNLYTDGLKIYTTINSKMQQAAEEAITKHLSKDLQPAFNKEQKKNKNKPFSASLSKEQIENIINTSIKRSDRYHSMKKNSKLSFEEIVEIFKKPVETTLFSWNGEIDTTISPYDSIVYMKNFLHSSLFSIEPQTGYVKAYAGGIDFKYFKFDNIYQGKRQVGSTFKPIIYCLAMQEGLTPCSQLPNIETKFRLPDGKEYAPAYSKTKYDGKMITLKQGLAHSMNQISAKLLKEFGEQAVINMARKLGIKSPMKPYPSLCVGAPDISLYEMVGAYSVFANKGVYIKPVYVTRIEDKYGNVIAEFKPLDVHEAISEETAYKTIELMKGVVEEGTSTRLKWKYGLKNEIAAKTGTTNDNSDGWFIGITPELVTGVWTGGEERSIRFSNTTFGQGANMALPVWAMYMKKVYDDKTIPYKPVPFEKPAAFPDGIICDDNNQNELFDDSPL